ncbi:hypothetical protein [Algoriphagus sp. NG3]|uniref:hypothetical protein n=1 Tax=Algoriphagus sp. NG3 TaxID=3097546 RepID=UPI002A7FD9FA|nr:hypothetical protein [Algoriphagus sp. NG3]WPR76335.1 hypothetical protein SLW71_03115 [Algoriphagus sp. NG3]
MGYRLFDISGTDVTHHDLQDKGVWCIEGASKEEAFVRLYGSELGLAINPEKITNPYAPDLLNTKNGKLGDLKTQNTPFFQAGSRFGLNPQHTVVFNGKDRDRYRSLYPEIEIYFAVDWQVVSFESSHSKVNVEAMVGIWFIPFGELDKVLEKAPFHSYRQRVYDNKGNAKGSYVLDLMNPAFRKVV